MLAPGPIFVEGQLRLTAKVRDSDGALVDPDTIIFRALSPSGGQTTLTYGSDADIQRVSTGNYTADLTPTEAGQWHYRWETTGTGTLTANEGSFNVRKSAFFDPVWQAYRGYC